MTNQLILHSNLSVNWEVFTMNGVLVGQYRYVIGSNFHFCVDLFKFSQSTFLNGCVNVDSIVRNFLFLADR